MLRSTEQTRSNKYKFHWYGSTFKIRSKFNFKNKSCQRGCQFEYPLEIHTEMPSNQRYEALFWNQDGVFNFYSQQISIELLSLITLNNGLILAKRLKLSYYILFRYILQAFHFSKRNLEEPLPRNIPRIFIYHPRSFGL